MKGRINLEKAAKAAKTKVNVDGNKRPLTEAGRVSIGVKSEKGYPMSVDYFVARGNFARIVTEKYGDKPNELPIFFYSDNFDEVCNERLEIRDTAGKLWAWGDGDSFMIYSPKIQEYVQCTTEQKPDLMDSMINLLTKDLEHGKAKLIEWQQVLTVRFVIKDVPVLGYWQFTTKAVKTTIPNLRDKFDSALDMFGTVRFFPFLMTVKKVKSNKPGDSRQYPIVDIVPGMSMETGLQLAQYIQENPSFNPAKIALMDLNDLKKESNIKLLLTTNTL